MYFEALVKNNAILLLKKGLEQISAHFYYNSLIWIISTCFPEELPIFGVPLVAAVQRNPCHDGVKIPLVIRNCIDYVQEHGMICLYAFPPQCSFCTCFFQGFRTPVSGITAEGIYKISGVKSRVQYVYALYNKRKTVYESDFDLTIATSLLKQFLRYLNQRHTC